MNLVIFLRVESDSASDHLDSTETTFTKNKRVFEMYKRERDLNQSFTFPKNTFLAFNLKCFVKITTIVKIDISQLKFPMISSVTQPLSHPLLLPESTRNWLPRVLRKLTIRAQIRLQISSPIFLTGVILNLDWNYAQVKTYNFGLRVILSK